MIDTSCTEMDSAMEALLEEELLGVNIDVDIDDSYDDPNENVSILQNAERIADFEKALDNIELPEEVEVYLNSLHSQTEQMEKELLLCDEALHGFPNSPAETSTAVVVYSDNKLLEDAAKEAGMSLEDFRQKLLKEIEQDDFTEEILNKEYNEFVELQKELAETRKGIRQTIRKDDTLKELLAIEAAKLANSQVLQAITNGQSDVNSSALLPMNDDKDDSDGEEKAGPLVGVIALVEMRDFIQSQLKKTEESFQQRERQLLESLETHTREEEKRRAWEEERKRTLQQKEQEEKAKIKEKNKMKEEMVAKETELQELALAEDLNYHQMEVEKLESFLKEERFQYELALNHWKESLLVTQNKAATAIQRVYRGHRTRRLMARQIKDLEELKELRVKERYAKRLMEVEYEMKLAKIEKEEREKKEAEERKQKEEEEKKRQEEIKRKEEEARKAEVSRKEMEKRKEEEKQEEERKKKEEEKRRKEEEKKKKEEEKQRLKEEEMRKKEEERLKKEEAKKLKEAEDQRRKEEERQKKEEQKRLKEEEKRLKEEERIKKEQEKKLKEEEEIRRKEDEKRNLEAEKRKKEEAEKQIKEKLQQATHGKNIEDQVNKNENAKTETENKSVSDNLPYDEFLVSTDPPPRFTDKDSRSHPSILTATNSGSSPYTPVAPVPRPVEPAPVMPTLTQPPPVLPTLTQPDPVELMRIAWIKSCTPWSKVSNEPWKLVQAKQNLHKRPTSAKKKFPPVEESVILTVSHSETLRQVSSVALVDLPACSLSTLAQCWSLKYLTVSNCGLVCLDGITQCKHLTYVNAEHNNIEYVDLKDLGSLQVVRLAHNKLNLIHGLTGCINLRWLDLSHNSITRISGLGALRRIHTLNLSHNQLVSSDGVDEAVTLQQLDLSHNFLQHFTGIGKLCLLTELNLSSNNLLEVPELKNQVLLQYLNLHENSISSLLDFGKYWMPLLSHLDCGENLIEQTQGMDHLIMLDYLDLSLNQITELTGLTNGLKCNKQLRTLLVDGNPLLDVYADEYISHTTKTLPFLKSLNGEPFESQHIENWVPENKEFYEMCAAQIKLHQSLKMDFENQISTILSGSAASMETVCNVYYSYCDISYKMATEHRNSHEYGNIPNITASNEGLSSKNLYGNTSKITPKLNSVDALQTNLNSQSGKPDSIVPGSMHNGESKKNNQAKSATKTALKSKAKIEESSSSSEESSSDTESNIVMNGGVKVHQPHPPPSSSGMLYLSEKDKFNMAISGNSHTSLAGSQLGENSNNNQSSVRMTDSLGQSSHVTSSLLHPATTSGKDKFNFVFLQQTGQIYTDHNKSAILQDNFAQPSKTGQLPRGTDLAGVATVVKSDGPASKVAENNQELMYENLDMDKLVDMDMEDLDFDIDKYLDVGELDEYLDDVWRPSDVPQLPQSSYPVLKKINSNENWNAHTSFTPTPPDQPVEAWREMSFKELRENNSQPLAVMSPSSQPSPYPSSVASGSVRSKREELSEEWGFKDSRTTDMMLAHAKKMKYNAERRKKLSKLDPQQRLQLFRKLEESGKVLSVRPPHPKVLPRKEYFQAREEEIHREDLDKRVEDHTRVHRTFEWIHTQVGDYPISSSRINPGQSNSNKIDNVMNKMNELGKTQDLRKASPLSDHHGSTSNMFATSQMRRYSLGEDYTSQTPTLPPINMKERISFRDAPIQRSGGWGGGKKRNSKN